METIDNYDLRFNVWSNGNGCAAADIVRGGDAPIKGVLYDIPDYLITRESAAERGRNSFDGIEGPAYQRQNIRVRMPDGSIVDAITYVVSNPRENLCTTADYVGHIVRGLREHQADEAYVARVKQVAIANNPAAARDIEAL